MPGAPVGERARVPFGHGGADPIAPIARPAARFRKDMIGDPGKGRVSASMDKAISGGKSQRDVPAAERKQRGFGERQFARHGHKLGIGQSHAMRPQDGRLVPSIGRLSEHVVDGYLHVPTAFDLR